MTHEQSALGNPAAAEQNAANQANLASTVTELLSNPELHDMTYEDQGKFIIDRFIGASVAAHQRGISRKHVRPFRLRTTCCGL